MADYLDRTDGEAVLRELRVAINPQLTEAHSTAESTTVPLLKSAMLGKVYAYQDVFSMLWRMQAGEWPLREEETL